MIRVTCPGCQSKLNAKEELLGQVRKCPKCGAAVRIEVVQATPLQTAAPKVVPPTAQASSVSQPESHPARPHATDEAGLPTKDAPARLDRQNHYLICDKAHLVATWENNGHGWMLKTGSGMISAKRNYEQIPSQGDFKLVELKLKMVEDGLHLIGIKVYQLSKRWALNNLERGDDQIVSAVTGAGSLNRDQKSVVRNLIKDQYMRHVWEHADNVLAYLGNTDFHSSGVG